MDVTVYQIGRPIRFDKLGKRFESTMGNRIKIVHSSSRSVCHEDIHSAMLPNSFPEFSDALLHLFLGIHIFTVSVLKRSAKSCDPKAIYFIDGVFYADAASRRVCHQVVIVIAPDVQYRARCHCRQKFQIDFMQISASQDQIEIVQLSRRIVFVVIF